MWAAFSRSLNQIIHFPFRAANFEWLRPACRRYFGCITHFNVHQKCHIPSITCICVLVWRLMNHNHFACRSSMCSNFNWRLRLLPVSHMYRWIRFCSRVRSLFACSHYIIRAEQRTGKSMNFIIYIQVYLEIYPRSRRWNSSHSHKKTIWYLSAKERIVHIVCDPTDDKKKHKNKTSVAQLAWMRSILAEKCIKLWTKEVVRFKRNRHFDLVKSWSLLKLFTVPAGDLWAPVKHIQLVETGALQPNWPLADSVSATIAWFDLTI